MMSGQVSVEQGDKAAAREWYLSHTPAHSPLLMLLWVQVQQGAEGMSDLSAAVDPCSHPRATGR